MWWEQQWLANKYNILWVIYVLLFKTTNNNVAMYVFKFKFYENGLSLIRRTVKVALTMLTIPEIILALNFKK